jgi:hypothetical protein
VTLTVPLKQGKDGIAVYVPKEAILMEMAAVISSSQRFFLFFFNT